MTNEKNQSSNQADQGNKATQSGNGGSRNSEQQNRPVGAEKMDESYSKPDPRNHQVGDSSRYANTSDNEYKEDQH